MRAVRSCSVTALLATLAVCPRPAAADPGVRVIVVPARPIYVLPPGYYRPYAPLYGDGAPLVPTPPSVLQFGAVPLQAPGVTLVPAPVNSGFQRFQPPLLWPSGGALFGGPAAGETEQALQLLSSPRERDRIDAAIALGRNRVERAVDPVARLLANDPSSQVREAAARALGLIGTPAALKPLQTAAQADADREVRRSAQFAAEAVRGGIQKP